MIPAFTFVLVFMVLYPSGSVFKLVPASAEASLQVRFGFHRFAPFLCELNIIPSQSSSYANR